MAEFLKYSLAFRIVREFDRLLGFVIFKYLKVFDLYDSVLIFDIDLINHIFIKAN